MKKTLFAGLAASLCMMSSVASAQIAGHNVILVHGIQLEDLVLHPNDEEVKEKGEDYWARGSWLANSEARMDYASDGRIEGRISEQLFEQAKGISRSGLCANGCVIVTHSLGDLVTRYFMANQDDWFAAAGLEPLNITAIIDIAGAGGGTELADLAVDVLNGDGASRAEEAAVQSFVGSDVGVESLAVVNDLQTGAARNLGTEPVQVPHLRYVTRSFSLTNPFISGRDDGVIPPHSSCGSTRAEGIDSCTNNVTFEGIRESTRGPTSLKRFHYPVLMVHGTGHVGAIATETGNDMTYVNNDFTAGLAVSLDTQVTSRKYFFGLLTEVKQLVVNGAEQTMPDVVFNSVNN